MMGKVQVDRYQNYPLRQACLSEIVHHKDIFTAWATLTLVSANIALSQSSQRVYKEIRKKKKLDKEWKRTKKSLLIPIAHEVSDDTSVCLWLISMENVSTTNTLLGKKQASPPMCASVSRLCLCSEQILWPRRPWKAPWTLIRNQSLSSAAIFGQQLRLTCVCLSQLRYLHILFVVISFDRETQLKWWYKWCQQSASHGMPLHSM